MTLGVTLSHRFGDFALTVDFTAPAGVTTLFGRSGAGKTTVVNAVAGLLRPDQGRIVVDGAVLLDTAAGVMVPPHRRRIGYVFQDARLFPHMDVRQNLLYGRWFNRRRAGPPLAEIVDLLGISHLLKRRPGALSGGERQRVAIGRAILANPRLLLLDEPLAALDAPRKAEILPYLERLRDGLDLPILHVSHDVAEVARLANTVVLLEQGRVIAAGPVATVLADPASAPALGRRETGALVPATVVEQAADGLTRLDSAAGILWLPQVAAAPGARLRLRILAHDVMIATGPLAGISALNIIPALVVEIRTGSGPGALVVLQAGTARLLARITQRSAQQLGLHPGQVVHAVIKAVAVAPDDVGAVSGPGI